MITYEEHLRQFHGYADDPVEGELHFYLIQPANGFGGNLDGSPYLPTYRDAIDNIEVWLSSKLGKTFRWSGDVTVVNSAKVMADFQRDPKGEAIAAMQSAGAPYFTDGHIIVGITVGLGMNTEQLQGGLSHGLRSGTVWKDGESLMLAHEKPDEHFANFCAMLAHEIITHAIGPDSGHVGIEGQFCIESEWWMGLSKCGFNLTSQKKLATTVFLG